MMVLGQYKAVLVGTWWYWVSVGHAQLVVLGQYKAVLVGFCWYRLLLEDLYFDDLCFYGNGLIVGGFNGFCGKILIVVIS